MQEVQLVVTYKCKMIWTQDSLVSSISTVRNKRHMKLEVDVFSFVAIGAEVETDHTQQKNGCPLLVQLFHKAETHPVF